MSSLFKQVYLNESTQPQSFADKALSVMDTFDLTPIQSFPVQISTEQQNRAIGDARQFDITKISLMDITQLKSEPEKALAKTVSQFLGRVTHTSPQIYRMVKNLNEAFEQEKVGTIAENIINPQPSGMGKFLGMFSKKKMQEAIDKTLNELSIALQGKTMNLNNLIDQMQRELELEQVKQMKELQEMQKLKDAYRTHFMQFVESVAYLLLIAEKARKDVAQLENSGKLDGSEINELKNKLTALENRVLNQQTLMLNLPADQLVITQLEEAGIITLSESTTTATARFTRIKMTLLSIHQALTTQALQRAQAHGAALDDNLAQVRSTLTKNVSLTAASMMGDNRVKDAERLKALVTDIKELQEAVDRARDEQKVKFELARNTLSDVTTQLAQLGTQIRPDVNRTI